MKQIDWLEPATCFQAYQANHNEKNRLVYSNLTSYEAKGRSRGLSVKYVKQGVEEYELGGRPYRVGAGECLLVQDGQEVATFLESDRTVSGICLYLDIELLAKAWHSSAIPERQLLDEGTQDWDIVPAVAERIYPAGQTVLYPLLQQVQRGAPETEEEEELLFLQLAEALCRHEYSVNQAINRLPSKRKSTREELHRRLLVARGFMQDNLDQPILIRDVARRAALSEFHFLRSFGQAFGCSPHQYLIRLRIDHAKRLLLWSDISITTVALECGFRDLQYFSRVFRRLVGLSPSYYRDNCGV